MGSAYGLYVKALNGSPRTASCSQVSLPKEAQIQSELRRTILGTWRTDLLTFASEAMDPSVQGRQSVM
jgi:hypothetical protein